MFKGGTALRKYRAGSSGRFSTDLDFSDTDQPVAELLLETLDGARLGGFAFRVEPINEHRRSTLHIETPFDVPELPARIDCPPKKSWLKPQLLSPIDLPIHAHYDIAIPPIPVMRIEEVLSEKLARYRRASLARDLYDLAWFARGGPMDESLIRRLTVMKIWFDVVDDGLGDRPFLPDDILRQRSEDEFREEDIGYLTTPVDIVGWELTTRRRFAFLTGLDATELSVSRCSPGIAGWSSNSSVTSTSSVVTRWSEQIRKSLLSTGIGRYGPAHEC